MPFNSRTYHANKAERDAREALEQAREYRSKGYSDELVSASAKAAIAYSRLARVLRRPLGSR